MSNLHQQPKVNVIRAGKLVGAIVEEKVTEMDWEDSFIDSFSVNSSNVFPSSSSLSIKRKRGQDDQQDDSEPSEKRVRIKEDGHKFRIPVTLSWSNRDRISCTKELNVLVDTGSEITIINTRMVVDQPMPWRHSRSPLTMSDGSGNRLPKSGKIIVIRVDLKVQDAKSKRFRTFRPTFEVVDLEIDEMVILSYDWFSETTERIVVGPTGGLEFKSPIQEIISETEEFTNVIRKAAFVGVIRIKQESIEGRRLMSISVSNENKLLMENVPLYYQKFEKVFGKEMQSELPEHGP